MLRNKRVQAKTYVLFLVRDGALSDFRSLDRQPLTTVRGMSFETYDLGRYTEECGLINRSNFRTAFGTN